MQLDPHYLQPACNHPARPTLRATEKFACHCGKLQMDARNRGKFPGEIAETGEAEKLGPANRFK
jgi:hypothetical protein